MVTRNDRLETDAIWPEEIEEAKKTTKPGMRILVCEAPFPRKDGDFVERKEIFVTSVGNHVLFGYDVKQDGTVDDKFSPTCYQWNDVVRADHEKFRIFDHSIQK